MSRFTGTVLVTGVVVLMLALGGCATAPVHTGVSGTSVGQPIPSRLSEEQASDVTIYAISLVGTPYRYGGNTPESGFDCSGLIGYVYRTRGGVSSPRTVSSLVNWGQPVPPGTGKTGDLVVFFQGGKATHAGIYVGEGRFVHAPSTGGEVRLDKLTSTYWARQQVSFRRP